MMQNKDTILFISECLSINHEQKTKEKVENKLKLNTINWDNVVKISTQHLVFPALYCNLKKAQFLHYLPTDLVDYMKEITSLNKDRNIQIIKQAKEVNTLLKSHNITPIFFKGTANLLKGLYDDIAERMTGDIDFLVLKDAKKANLILQKHGYKEFYKEDILVKNHRHLPRIVHPTKIAALEIHTKILTKNYDKPLKIAQKQPFLEKENITFFNAEYNLISTILSKQINDNGYLLKKINLKVCYDVFLESKNTKFLPLLNNKLPYFKIINNYVGLTSYLFNNPNSLSHIKNKHTSIKCLNLYFNNHFSFSKILLKLSDFYIALVNFITKKTFRKYFISIIRSKLNF